MQLLQTTRMSRGWLSGWMKHSVGCLMHQPPYTHLKLSSRFFNTPLTKQSGQEKAGGEDLLILKNKRAFCNAISADIRITDAQTSGSPTCCVCDIRN